MTDCPVCGRSGTMKGEDRSGHDAVQFKCQKACGVFFMDGLFHTHTWPTVSNEDREAIAVYLRITKEKRDNKIIIFADNYKVYVREGKRLKRNAA
jgi:hypothetical protein